MRNWRRFLLALMIYSCSLPIYSQVEWAPIGAIWYYGESTGGFAPPNYYYSTLESVGTKEVQGKECKWLQFAQYFDAETRVKALGDSFELLGFHRDSINFYFYQEGRKLYWYHYLKDTFQLIYDFDKGVGDTLVVNYDLYNEETSKLDSYELLYRIDSTKSVEIGGQFHKANYLRNIANFSNDIFLEQFSGWQIEGIGSSIFFTPLVDLLTTDLGNTSFRCYADDIKSYMQLGTFTPSCTYVPVENHNIQVDIFPNPVHRQLKIRFNSNSDRRLRLVSINGVTVLDKQSTEGEVKLDVAGIPVGMYILQVQEKSLSQTFKIMIE